MKAKVGIIALVLSISIFTLTCNDRDDRNIDEEPNNLSFAKYYEPYEVDIEPNAAGYKLPLDLNDIVNVNAIKKIVDYNSISNLIEQNGFAILDSPRPDCDDIEFLYEDFLTMDIPVFVTIDTLLHIYHIQFEWAIRDIEECKFASDINDLTDALLDYSMQLYDQLDGNLQEAAKRNVAYLSVAQRLIAPDRQAPELVADIVTRELAKIDAHRGHDVSDIFTSAILQNNDVVRPYGLSSEGWPRGFD